MNLEEIRSSFTLYVLDSQPKRSESVVVELSKSGYQCLRFQELTGAFSEFITNPPHFILIHFADIRDKAEHVIGEIHSQLPETHVFIICDAADRVTVEDLVAKGIYDLITLPITSAAVLVKSIDRAAERDYYMYLNEQLNVERAQKEDTHSKLDTMSEGSIKTEVTRFTRGLFQAKSLDEAVGQYLEEFSHLSAGRRAVYFKYSSNRRAIVAAHGVNLNNLDLRGVGLNLNEVVADFRTDRLRQAQDISEIRDMIREVFDEEHFFSWHLEILGDLVGVFFFLGDELEPEVIRTLETGMILLQRSGAMLEMERRLHAIALKDTTTEVLNRNHFLVRINEEIARSRRTGMATSLLMLSLDQYPDLMSRYGREDCDTVLRMVARIFERHSRINDIVGRIGVDEFAILLPHTSLTGATIKAERLRRMLESADFSKVLKSLTTLTICVGVSEYPSICRDAEELIQTADEALYQVRKTHNKVCVAKPQEGFMADFVVKDKVF